jgi:hypothetical protein
MPHQEIAPAASPAASSERRLKAEVEKQQSLKTTIQSVVRTRMDRVMANVLVNDPFDVEQHRLLRPLYAALVPDEIFRSAHFERRFVTPFGHLWEELARIVAATALGYAVRGHPIAGAVKAGRLQRIQEVLDRLEHPPVRGARVRPAWDDELAYILAAGGDDVATTVVCDLYVEDRQTRPPRRYAFEVKAPLPNSDQTKVSKDKLLRLHSMEPSTVDDAFFALPYNPYGRREDYAWGFPARWFDMRRDRVVLIGDGFWDMIGGAGTYRAFVDAVNEIGREYKPRIYREYLGIEPPPDATQGELTPA